MRNIGAFLEKITKYQKLHFDEWIQKWSGHSTSIPNVLYKRLLTTFTLYHDGLTFPVIYSITYLHLL